MIPRRAIRAVVVWALLPLCAAPSAWAQSPEPPVRDQLPEPKAGEQLREPLGHDQVPEPRVREQLPQPRVREQLPAPRVRDRSAALETAMAAFDAGHWDEAVAAFERAARDGAGPLPAEALRRWGIAAGEAGLPFAAYVRLRQWLAVEPDGPDRRALEARTRQTREVLLSLAGHFSRLTAASERSAGGAPLPERAVVRIAARDRGVSLEGMGGSPESPLWRRAEEVALGPYLDLLGRLLDAPAVLEDCPTQRADPSESPRHAAMIRLVIGDEERRLEAVRGEPYARVAQAAGWVVDYARTARANADGAPKAPVRTGKKRR